MSAEIAHVARLEMPATSNGTGRHLQFDDRPAIDPYADLNASVIDWATFWQEDIEPEQWLVEPIIPKGRSVALWAPAKQGKSTVVLAGIAAACSGEPVYGSKRHAPVKVLYLDYEMTKADVFERLDGMGYGEHSDLANLHYSLLPHLEALDTDNGGIKLAGWAEHLGVDLVIVDTYGRAVVAPEDKADTTRAFYRYTGSRLKEIGISVLRTDHGGKDVELGQRGSSAKNDDVDVVWQLKKLDNGARLTRNMSRMSWVPATIELARVTDPDSGSITYRMTKGSRGYAPGTKELCGDLDALGVPLDIGRTKLRREYPQVKATNSVISDALRFRREQAELASLEASKGAKAVRRTGSADRSVGQVGQVGISPGQDHRTATRTDSDSHTDRSRYVVPDRSGPTETADDDGFNPDDYADIEFPDEWSHQ